MWVSTGQRARQSGNTRCLGTGQTHGHLAYNKENSVEGDKGVLKHGSLFNRRKKKTWPTPAQHNKQPLKSDCGSKRRRRNTFSKRWAKFMIR